MGQKQGKKGAEEILIRGYVQADLPEMLMIWNEVVEEGEAFPQEECLVIDSGSAFFAEQSRCAVAYDQESASVVGLYILHPNNIGRCGHICNASYAVDPAWRGKQIGEKLVRDSIRAAKKLGFRILQFNAVAEHNTSAKKLYERIGFQTLGKIPGGFRRKDGTYETICPYYLDLTEAASTEQPARIAEDAEKAAEHGALSADQSFTLRASDTEEAQGTGISDSPESFETLREIREEAGEAVRELLDRAGLEAGKILVVGCSSSEVAAHKIGSFSSEEIGETIFEAIREETEARGIYLAAQCCEHLNRCLIVEHRLVREYRLEEVNVVPQLKAGGSFATAAWKNFRQPAAVSSIKAHAGIDIGDTLIGMHLKSVAVPVRIKVRKIGAARVVCARTRLPYIGGERAHYQKDLTGIAEE